MSINLTNYEEWFVAFLDNELSAEEVKAFELFLEKNPQLQVELAYFKSLKFETTEAVFFDKKETLYKKDSGLVGLKRAWPLAAAILLLLGMVPFLKNTDTMQSEVRANKKTEEKLPAKPHEAIAIANQTAQDTIAPVRPRMIYTPPIIKEKVLQEMLPPEKRIASGKNKIKNKQGEMLPEKPYEQAVKKQEIVKKQVIATFAPEKKIQEQPLAIIEKKTPKLDEPRPTAHGEIPQAVTKEKGLLLAVNENAHPALHTKLNEVVTKVESKLEALKELKRSPLTVSIGKQKLFTINN